MRYHPTGELRGTPKQLEKAIQDSIGQAGIRGFSLKGESWGAALAEWCVTNDAPPQLADDDGFRPIEGVCRTLLRGRISDYELSREQIAEDTQAVAATNDSQTQ